MFNKIKKEDNPQSGGQKQDKNPLCQPANDACDKDKCCESEELQKKLEESEKQKAEYLESWKKERASFLNYKKEEMERIGEFIKYANTEIILRILPMLDNFLTAEQNIPDDLKKDEHIKGILQIYQQMKDFLKSQGIEEIDAIGKKFDPNFHEAIEEVGPSEALAKEAESGIIVEEMQKGYKLNGRVIRPAKVKISK